MIHTLNLITGNDHTLRKNETSLINSTHLIHISNAAMVTVSIIISRTNGTAIIAISSGVVVVALVPDGVRLTTEDEEWLTSK